MAGSSRASVPARPCSGTRTPGVYCGPGRSRATPGYAAAGSELAVLPGHAGPTGWPVVAPDGRWLATSGGADRMVRVWRLDRFPDRLTARRPGQAECRLVGVAAHPDGRRLAATGDDGS